MNDKRIVFLFIWIFVIFHGALQSQKTVDQKISEIEDKLTRATGKERIDVLLQMAEAHFSRSTDTMLKYSNEALALARRLRDLSGEADSQYVKGMAYCLQNKYDSALECFWEAMRCAEEAKNKELIAKATLGLGNVYYMIYDYVKSLDYHLKSLKTYEEMGDKKGTALGLANVGNVYKRIGEFNKSLEYTQKALKMNLELKENRSAAQCYNDIGSINRELKNFKESLASFAKALSIYEKGGDWHGMGYTQTFLGNTYNDMGDYRKALDSYAEAMKFQKKLGNSPGIADCLNGIGYSYMKLRDFSRALPALREALKMASELNDKGLLIINSEITSELYAGQGNFKKALEFLKKQMETDKMIINEKNFQQINNLQIQYDTLKKKSENERLLRENELQGLRLAKVRIVRNASIVGLALILVILLLLFQKYLYLFAFWKKQKYIGRYRLLEPIGSGGMGVVYKAHSIHKKSDLVAIKVLKDELSADESVVKRFMRESVFADKIDHPHIVKIYERGEDRHRLFLAMEYLQGETLAEKIAKEGRLDLRVGIHIMEQLADAMGQIHAVGIVHRDLKPSNIILVRDDGDPHFLKLLDFGLARGGVETTLTKTGEILGTIGYMPPEQLLDEEITVASDVYSMGVIWYEMVCGRKLFEGENDVRIIRMVLSEMPVEPLRLRPEIPPDMNRMMMKMLEKDPSLRPSLEQLLESVASFSHASG